MPTTRIGPEIFIKQLQAYFVKYFGVWMLFHEHSNFREKLVNAVSGGLFIARAIVKWLGRNPCRKFNPENVNRNCVKRLRFRKHETFPPFFFSNRTPHITPPLF